MLTILTSLNEIKNKKIEGTKLKVRTAKNQVRGNFFPTGLFNYGIVSPKKL